MRIEYGNAGWVRLSEDDFPGYLYLRFDVDRPRPVVAELYLDARGSAISPSLLRRLNLAALTADVMLDRDWLSDRAQIPGPDLSRAASHFATSWGKADHWVADSWKAQIAGSGVPQAPMGADHRPSRAVGQPPPVTPPDDGLTDEFLRSVAANYVYLVNIGKSPAPAIREQLGGHYSVRTVHSWVRKARERGLLARTSRGSVR